MKFARFLQDNLTPEWKRAYIDYKGLKKILKKIDGQGSGASNQAGADSDASSHDGHPSHRPTPTTAAQALADQVRKSTDGRQNSALSHRSRGVDDGEDGGDEDDEPRSGHSSLGRQTHHAVSDGTGKGYGSMESTPPWNVVSKNQQPPPEEVLITRTSPDNSPPKPSSTSPPALSRMTPSTALGSHMSPAPPTQPQPHHPPPLPAPPLPPSSVHSEARSVGDEEADQVAPLTPTPASPLASRARKSPRFFLPNRTTTEPKDLPKSPASIGPRSSSSSSRRPPMSPKFALPSPKMTASRSPKSARSRGRSMSSLKGDPAGAILGHEAGGGPPRTGVLALIGTRPGTGSDKNSSRPPMSLDEILPSLLPQERKFVDALDKELDKVEKFYCEREAEMKDRVQNLKRQMAELAEHRRVFHQYHPDRNPKAATYLKAFKPIENLVAPILPANLIHPLHPSQSTPNLARSSLDRSDEMHLSDPKEAAYNPDAYKRYKRRLRAATLEAYKGLELLKNYRVLNLTGFRKALKKFEKAAKLHIMGAYTADRIDKMTFSSPQAVDDLLEEVETLYAARFENGDHKKARERLRVTASTKTHHRSTFMTGIYIGLAVPVFVHSIVLSFQAGTRAALPEWAALLQVYGAALLPVVFALLFGFNLHAWVSARINYRFILELDIRTVLDHRQYIEIPAFFLVTLCWCMWFTFSRAGESHIDPTSWPLIWLVFVVAIMANPAPIFFRDSRYWFIKCLWRVVTPGYSGVTFAAFFLADELNSLVWSIYNIWFLACAQNCHWTNIYAGTHANCNQYKSWVPALLSCLPALSRLLQCLQRYRDSGLQLHLINAGKYLSTIITAITYFLWRSRGNSVSDVTFPIWVITASITSIYSCSWDFVIDWSVMSPKDNFLRKDRLYKDYTWAYYFALVTNLLIRCIWVGYIPKGGLNIRVRAFVFYALEMLRRFQWNFFRVENEQLGNSDAYRVTRELPLPYEVQGMYDDGDSSQGEEEKASVAAKSSRTRESAGLRLSRMVSRRSTMGKNATTDDEEARGAGMSV